MANTNQYLIAKSSELELALQESKTREEDARRNTSRLQCQLDLLHQLLRELDAGESPKKADDSSHAQQAIQEEIQAVDEHEAEQRVLNFAAAILDPEPSDDLNKKTPGMAEIIAMLPDLPHRFTWKDVEILAKKKGYKHVEPAPLRNKLNLLVKEQKWFVPVDGINRKGPHPTIFEKVHP